MIDTIPFSDIDKKQVIPADERTLKILYPSHTVTILGSGWGGYHVIMEDGVTNKTKYQLMSAKKLQLVFKIDLSKYE